MAVVIGASSRRLAGTLSPAVAACSRRPRQHPARPPLDFVGERGPFDIVGDVHGCAGELRALLAKLGYPRAVGEHPLGRRLIFVGDLVDRGPDSPTVLRTAMAMTRAGSALCVDGNHERRLRRHLRGERVTPTHGLDATLAQLEGQPAAFLEQVRSFLEALPGHLVLDGGRLVVAHAGLPLCLHGVDSGRARAFAMYGFNSGALPSDHPEGGADWARHYRGAAYVALGHHPVRELGWRGRVLNLDTGCVFGGRLSALRFPEMELTSVPAAQAWAPDVRWNPLLEEGLAACPS